MSKILKIFLVFLLATTPVFAAASTTRPNPFDLVPEEDQKKFPDSKDQLTTGVAEGAIVNIPIFLDGFFGLSDFSNIITTLDILHPNASPNTNPNASPNTNPNLNGLAGLCPAGGKEISAQLASKIQGGIVHLLPNTVTPRSPGSRLCITPTMIVMHWSGGWDNDQGNDGTYGTLIQRNLACQLASDTNDTYIMQPFYETQVEFPWCCNDWNIYSINNEEAGGFVSSPTDPRGVFDLRFTDENGNPPRIGNPLKPNQHIFPEKSVVDHAVSVTCAIMKQYNIPWTQIFGHYNVPGAGAQDPGKEYLETYFIPRVQKECK